MPPVENNQFRFGKTGDQQEKEAEDQEVLFILGQGRPGEKAANLFPSALKERIRLNPGPFERGHCQQAVGKPFNQGKTEEKDDHAPDPVALRRVGEGFRSRRYSLENRVDQEIKVSQGYAANAEAVKKKDEDEYRQQVMEKDLPRHQQDISPVIKDLLRGELPPEDLGGLTQPFQPPLSRPG